MLFFGIDLIKLHLCVVFMLSEKEEKERRVDEWNRLGYGERHWTESPATFTPSQSVSTVGPASRRRGVCQVFVVCLVE